MSALHRVGVLVLAVGVAGCTSNAPAGDAHLPTASTTLSAQLRSLPAQSPTASASVPSECAPGADRTVTELPDVVVPGVQLGDLASAGPDGGTLPGTRIDTVVVAGGCIVRHAAPAGCVGAVEISGVAIPAVTIPATTLPAARLGDRAVPARTFPAVTVPGVRVPGVSSPQTCQERTSRGLATVTRPGVVRRAASRPGGSRPGGTREGLCADGRCIPAVVVPTVRVEPVKVPDVDVDPVRLQRTKVRAGVDRIEGDGRTAYLAPADVLFDVDRATLRPGAAAALRVIAGRLSGTTGRITVEGHTDSTNTTAYNLALSRRRAEAVARWLSGPGGVTGSRIRVLARGETSPSHTNATAAGRALNRRVVISVSD